MLQTSFQSLLRSSKVHNHIHKLFVINQWRRHGEDWGGHVPPSSLQGQFSNLSKSGEKNGGGVYVCDISLVI